MESVNVIAAKMGSPALSQESFKHVSFPAGGSDWMRFQWHSGSSMMLAVRAAGVPAKENGAANFFSGVASDRR